VLEDLNTQQLEAVCADIGPLLVLAGAGSGKTRVLVQRITWLIKNHNVYPGQILSVTFTNKAAHEMRRRLQDMVDGDVASMWVGTFHGLAHKMLRQNNKEVGLPDNFQVIDSEDQLAIIRRLMKQMEVDEDNWPPKKAQYYINGKKDEGLRSGSLVATHTHEAVFIEVFKRYDEICLTEGLVDFAELLLRGYELLDNAVVLARYQAKFTHILVDEFQDTNTIQYAWLQKLAMRAHSITIVGDDDQSIYGWRGAKVENIDKFQKDYANCKVVRLEQNYRSTELILSAANSLISNNTQRMGKNLWTDAGPGDKIQVYGALNEDDESLYVVRKVQDYLAQGKNAKDVAVLYRSNAQSRVLEEAFVRVGIPYVIYGGLRFFERAEIKDAMAYLRLVISPDDTSAFERVINVPPRGVGAKSIEKIRAVSAQYNVSLLQAGEIAVDESLLTGKARGGVETFLKIIESLQEIMQTGTLADVVVKIIEKSGLLVHFKEQRGEKAQARAENLEELINASGDFVSQSQESGANLTNAEVILEFISYAALDSGDKKSHDQDAVQMMTLHSAKGLEFPMVFICGVEEGLFPHYLTKDDPMGVEEERRLCYVGITRAMQMLHITHANRRRLFGREDIRTASRFIEEIPAKFKNSKSRKMEVSPPAHYRMPIAPKNPAYGGKAYGYTQYRSTKVTKGTSCAGYSLGQRVSHKKFGIGVVTDFEGDGERARINIQFEISGTKWLAIGYAKLEIVD
jgi:DNA helicase II / ATP-dependent DNA helicase PcrA